MFAKSLTFDDVLLVPKKGIVNSRKEVKLNCRLTKNISLSVPLVSSNMDSVTESDMAIAMARRGGIGFIHRFCSIEDQCEMVKRVKRAQNCLITDPWSIELEKTISEAEEYMNEKGVNTLLVLDFDEKFYGILTREDINLVDNKETTVEYACKTKGLVTTTNENITFEEAKEIFRENHFKKLPVLDNKGYIKGLITLKDINNKSNFPLMSLDSEGRLLVGAAIGVNSDYIERAEGLIDAGADVIVIDIAHGHSEIAINATKEFKKRFPKTELVVGNVCTEEGYRDLVEAGADAVKVGVGGGCFSADTKVEMYETDKEKTISELKVGDIINGGDLRPTQVKKIIYTGMKCLSRLKIKGYPDYIYVTKDHRFWVEGDRWETIYDIYNDPNIGLFHGTEIEEYIQNYKCDQSWDIEVESPSHSFRIAGGRCIVHNSVCITRKVTGFGVPQLSAILDCSKPKQQTIEKYGQMKDFEVYSSIVPIIADGGIRTSGDIVKSIVAGADTVMMGSKLAGTDESPGKIIDKNGKKCKVLRGMAGTFANLSKDSKLRKKTSTKEVPYELTAEGVEGITDYKGSVHSVLTKLIDGIRSGVSYGGGKELKDIRNNVEMKLITNSGLIESGSHDLRLS